MKVTSVSLYLQLYFGNVFIYLFILQVVLNSINAMELENNSLRTEMFTKAIGSLTKCAETETWNTNLVRSILVGLVSYNSGPLF